MSKPLGKFALVLHGHLPYVLAHGRWPHGLDMLCECAAESYLPLLHTLRRLVAEGYSPQITIGLTPILSEQLADGDFKHEFYAYLCRRIEMAKEDEAFFIKADEPHYAYLAHKWQDHYSWLVEIFNDHYHQDIVGAFSQLQNEGHIEIMTSAATHGYFPLLGSDISIQAQVKQGVAAYHRHFGRAPKGFWLPECAYRPSYWWQSPLSDAGPQQPVLRKGVEEFLSEAGLDYFFIDTHLLAGGEAIGVYLDRFEALQNLWQQFQDQYQPRPEVGDRSPYRPYLVSSAPKGKKPVAVFVRDPKSGTQVWSAECGYPGDEWYLDFHKKHHLNGLRYWRVTASSLGMGDKLPYVPENAAARPEEHASHFVEVVKGILSEYQQTHNEAGVICSPYDAELFGHWWFEGPDWLYHVLRKLNEDPEVAPVTCSEALAEHRPDTVVALPEGSWGQGGFHWIWLNEWTEWIWRKIYQAEADMEALAKEFAGRKDDENLQKILHQAGRELLLLEASDWEFLISTWTARDYAEMRAEHHFHWFERLAAMARRYGRGEWVEEEDWTFLGEAENRDAIFPEADPGWWEKLDFPPQ
jgi:1,4-alpha-glucan branching enzyme